MLKNLSNSNETGLFQDARTYAKTDTNGTVSALGMRPTLAGTVTTIPLLQ